MIKENVQRILAELPEGVQLVAAAKTRTPEEIYQAVEAGLKIIGENYVQEAEQAFQIIGNRVQWHMIGHLQRNKVKKAVRIFDLIETVDSMRLAQEIDKSCSKIGKIMPQEYGIKMKALDGSESDLPYFFQDEIVKLFK